jgi:hypothetical protein
MKAKDFVVIKRPKLANITKHPTIEFADYEAAVGIDAVYYAIDPASLSWDP